MRDAPFSLLPGLPYTARVNPDQLASLQAGTWVRRETTYPGAAPVGRFRDSQGYYPGAEEVTLGPREPGRKWMTRQWDSSVVMPSRKPYGMKAPGYRAGTELLYNCRVKEDGRLNCPPSSNITSMASDGGNGNPADVNGQYGWNAQILTQTDTKGVVQIWNGAKEPALVVTTGAAFQAGGVSPGQVATFHGAAIGPPSPAGTRVLFDGVAAQIVDARAQQLSALVPGSVAGKSSTEVQVEYNGVLTKKVVVPVVPGP
jgi:hypothetical protein